jgi:hypothetical protein
MQIQEGERAHVDVGIWKWSSVVGMHGGEVGC